MRCRLPISPPTMQRLLHRFCDSNMNVSIRRQIELVVNLLTRTALPESMCSCASMLFELPAYADFLITGNIIDQQSWSWGRDKPEKGNPIANNTINNRSTSALFGNPVVASLAGSIDIVQIRWIRRWALTSFIVCTKCIKRECFAILWIGSGDGSCSSRIISSCSSECALIEFLCQDLVMEIAVWAASEWFCARRNRPIEISVCIFPGSLQHYKSPSWGRISISSTTACGERR